MPKTSEALDDKIWVDDHVIFVDVIRSSILFETPRDNVTLNEGTRRDKPLTFYLTV